ncbi:MAG: HD domain-containing protein [Bacteroidia bacterium]
MTKNKTNKLKIFNDPIYGFITIPFPIIHDLIEHPYFQRLRRIKQVGMSHMVYPGALHTRFHHAMGAMHLMTQAIEVLRFKGVRISDDEAKGVTIAILLHDIGHGPFSHALEHSIVSGVHHEDLSSLFMQRLNEKFKGQLDTAIRIFNNTYPKKFLHQLVSGQLDMDRMDYLNRDSFYSGVSEGVISYDRIIKMLNVHKDQLVVEDKGIYSIEKFIVARRLMYWQVYLHKTVLSAENLLVNILSRAKFLANKGEELFATPAFHYFLYNKVSKKDFEKNPALLDLFAQLDDYDIHTSIKVWMNHHDKVLARLCSNMVERKLFRIELQAKKIDTAYVNAKKSEVIKKYKIEKEEADYFVFTGSISNNAYNPQSDKINILFKDGQLKDITEASDQLNIRALSTPVEKFFICYPKDC